MAKAIVQKGNVSVYSTLANPQKFTVWNPPVEPGGLHTEKLSVVIAGGAGIANKNLITPLGVHTSITEEELAEIAQLKHFKDFVERGYIKVEKRYTADIEKAVSDMNTNDPGGPLTPADFAATPADGKVPVPVELEKAGTGWVANQVTAR